MSAAHGRGGRASGRTSLSTGLLGSRHSCTAGASSAVNELSRLSPRASRAASSSRSVTAGWRRQGGMHRREWERKLDGGPSLSFMLPNIRPFV